MFDNICTLPLSADLFCLAFHPSQPLFAIGLSSGHVETIRLPSASDTNSKPKANGNGDNSKQLKRQSSTSSLSSSAPPPHNLTSLWRTRRHNGSCRALAFSPDGSTLFSAGTDGLLKAARIEDGWVVGKITFITGEKKSEDKPSTLVALSSQTLVLGMDSGAVHLHDLKSTDGYLIPLAKRTQTFNPHRTEDDPQNSDPINTIFPIPPSGTSTSGTSRAFISLAGNTLAVTDIRKNAIIAVSDVQSDDLQGVTCLRAASTSEKDMFLVGDGEGKLNFFERGEWISKSRSMTIPALSPTAKISPLGIERNVECVAMCPRNFKGNDAICAVGLGNGTVKFVVVNSPGTKRTRYVGSVESEVVHDEQGFDGVTALGFDVEGRLVTGGGQFIRVWHKTKADEKDASQAKDNDMHPEKTVKFADVDKASDSSTTKRKRSVMNITASDPFAFLFEAAAKMKNRGGNSKQDDKDDQEDEQDQEDQDDIQEESESHDSSESDDSLDSPHPPPRKKRRKGKNTKNLDGRNSHGILKIPGIS